MAKDVTVRHRYLVGVVASMVRCRNVKGKRLPLLSSSPALPSDTRSPAYGLSCPQAAARSSHCAKLQRRVLLSRAPRCPNAAIVLLAA